MVGLASDGATFWHYTLLNWLEVRVFVCMHAMSFRATPNLATTATHLVHQVLAMLTLGQLLVSALPNAQIAQIASGVFLSLFNLFGG